MADWAIRTQNGRVLVFDGRSADWQPPGHVVESVLLATGFLDSLPAGHTVLDISNGTPVTGMPAPTPDDIEGEFRRRMAAGFTWAGTVYQIDQESQSNINAAYSLAREYLTQNPTQGASLDWMGQAGAGSWIAMDNSITQMTADDMIAFATAAGHFVARLKVARRRLKDTLPVGYATDALWP